MAQKFHINSHGQPAACKAQEGSCPLGGAESHFDSKEACQEQINKIAEGKYSVTGGVAAIKPKEEPQVAPKAQTDEGRKVLEGAELEARKAELFAVKPEDDIYDETTFIDVDTLETGSFISADETFGEYIEEYMEEKQLPDFETVTVYADGRNFGETTFEDFKENTISWIYDTFVEPPTYSSGPGVYDQEYDEFYPYEEKIVDENYLNCCLDIKFPEKNINNLSMSLDNYKPTDSALKNTYTTNLTFEFK